jgi:hypothetical protein
MAVERLPGGAGEFAGYLDGLLARLDQGGGWSGVFWRRDPDGMRACLDGREVPPWDVVEALLEDLTAAYGPAAAAAERERARSLHRSALTAHDARPGAREALLDHLDVMLHEQHRAAERRAGLTRRLSSPATATEAESLRLDLAWADDDHARATARCAELRSRLAQLDRRAAMRARGMRHGHETAPSWAAGGRGAEGVPQEAPPGFREAERDGRTVEGEQWGVGRSGGTWLGDRFRQPRAEAEDLEVRGPGAAAEASPPPLGTGSDRTRRPSGPADHSAADAEPWVRGPVPGDARGAVGRLSGPAEAPRDAVPGPVRQADRRTPAPYAAPSAPAPHTFTPAPGAAPSPRAGHAMRAASSPPQAASPSPGAGRSAHATPHPPGAGRTSQAASPSPGARQEAQDVPAFPPPAQAPEAAAPPAPRPTPVAPHTATSVPDPAQSTPPAKPRKRRRGSARFAGMAEEGAAAAAVLPQAAPPVVPEAPARRTPRGARFAGAGQADEPVVVAHAEVVDAEAAAVVAGVVERLARLRAEGRSGEAHAVLVEVAQWPAGRFPALADGLHRAGLGADWATLLWETASLPPERLVAAADALVAAGRAADARQMLRQGVARPAEQIGAAVLRLEEEGRDREAAALLDAVVRGRTAQEAARCVAPDPRRLVPLLLGAARAFSDERHWDLVHALRVAGHAT